ncbi:hypothetical protein HN011_004125 [Eciton burchellii]|nr:hypothetical protein HN011_004125 [Eciton burchellii]
MHSISVDMNELDPKIAYVQVTHVVTPCFEKSELEIRQTEFEQNHNISCFMFKTPFKESKAKDKPEDQNGLKSLKNAVKLSAIKVALDKMRRYVQELKDMALIGPISPKKLQLCF